MANDNRMSELIRAELDRWETTAAEALEPRTMSAGSARDREAFLAGCYALGLLGRGKTLKPQQLLLADVLGAGERHTAALMPRRSTKTTSLFAWGIGRCMTVPDQFIGYTSCTTGKKARARFLKDVVPVMNRIWPDRLHRPFSIHIAAGMEQIRFQNGSVFEILAPHGDDFRSDAFDAIILDEAGEADREMGDDLLSAALPTQDTRPGSMLVVAGTAGDSRRGNLLWDQLEEGRAGRGGIIEYAAGVDAIAAEVIEDWPAVEALLKTSHPGIGTLTTVDTIHGNWYSMMQRHKPDLFAQEYLGIFGTQGSAGGAVDLNAYLECEVDGDLPEPPPKFALAISVSALQTAACVVAAWRDADGHGRLAVLAHKEGSQWIGEKARDLSIRYRTPIVYDNFGTVLVEVERMSRMKPRPRMEPQNVKESATAAALIVQEFRDRNIRHWGQAALTAAVTAARVRPIGARGFAFGRGDPLDDITALEAASLALRYYDAMPARGKITVLRPTG